MGLGVRHVGSRRLTWRLLVGLVRYSANDSALMRAAHGEQMAWSPAEYLLAIVVDLLQLDLWFQTEDGHKNRNRPQPVNRPGQRSAGGMSLGGKGIATDLADFKVKYAALAAKQEAEKATQEAESGKMDT